VSLVDIVTLIVLGASITIGVIMFWCDVTDCWNYVFRRLAGTSFKKNESSAVPSSNAVRNGGPLLCPNAKPPTVMPTRNTATTIAGCRA
jgi:hypothetical protein